MRTILDERLIGKRIIAGTEWAVRGQLVRVTFGRKPTEWQIVRSLCNGVPDLPSLLFVRLSDARKAWGEMAVQA